MVYSDKIPNRVLKKWEKLNIFKVEHDHKFNNRLIKPDGYVYESVKKTKKHPNKREKGVLHHRVLMEEFISKMLGEKYYLTKEQVVHHIDGDRMNNKINNLLVFKNNSNHIKFHHLQNKLKAKI